GPYDLAIAASIALLDRELRTCAARDRRHGCGETVGVIVGNELVQLTVQQLFAGVAKELLHGSIRGDDPAIGIDECDADGGVLKDGSEARLAGQHGFVGPILSRDIPAVAVNRVPFIGQGSVRVWCGRHRRAHPLYDAHDRPPATVRVQSRYGRNVSGFRPPCASVPIAATWDDRGNTGLPLRLPVQATVHPSAGGRSA